MGCPRLRGCGEPAILCLGMITVALPSSSLAFPQKEVDLVCLKVHTGDYLGEGGSACSLLSGLQQGLPCSFIGSCILEQQF